MEGIVEGPQSELLTILKMLSVSQRHRTGTALPSVFYSVVLHADGRAFWVLCIFLSCATSMFLLPCCLTR